MGSAGAEVEVAVLVHRSHLEDGDVQRVGTLAVVAGQLRIADGGVEREALCDGFALDAAHVPAVPGHVGSGVVDLEDLRHPHQDAAAEIDVLQFGQALGKGGVHGHGGVDAPTVIHPVAALDQRSSLFGSRFFPVRTLSYHTPAVSLGSTGQKPPAAAHLHSLVITLTNIIIKPSSAKKCLEGQFD